MIIDCHAHHIAAPYNTHYLEWLKATGNKDFGPFYLWNDPAFENETIRYKKAEQAGIDCSIITYSANITQIVDAAANHPEGTPENGPAGASAHDPTMPRPSSTPVTVTEDPRLDIVRDINTKTIKLCQESAGRLLPTALIDLRLGIPALAELERCAPDVVGYSVLAAYKKGTRICFLDDPAFEPFWKEAEIMGKPVFIHFSNLYKINDPAAPLPGHMNDTLLYAGMGQLMEDALCVARLVLSGVFDRHPRLCIVMGQAGGMYPFMLERMDMLYHMYAAGAAKAGLVVTDKNIPEKFMRNMKDYTDNIYVDTHSMNALSIQCAAQILGEDKILFGSDYPITPDSWGMTTALEGLKTLPEQLMDKIFFKNARSLLNIN